jgi:outer membrane protein TolC
MIKTITIFTTVFFTSTILLANTTELSLISNSVSKHPNVVEKANEITLKGISLEQILAEDGLQISISTKSKLPISYRLNDNKTRADDLDRSFLDGIVSAQKTLYDFGVIDYKVNAEKSRKKALELEYVQVYETTLQKLLGTANDVVRLNILLINLKQNISTAKSSIEEIKLRFTSGVGTVMDVRQAQLLLLDIETEAETLQRELNAKLSILKAEFGVPANQLHSINTLINDFNNLLISTHQNVALVINSDINYQRSQQIIDLEKSALSNQIKSLKSENMPQLSASLTVIAYDVTRGLDEYELYGGINLSMPLYDSGLSDTKKRSLTYRLKVQDDMILALNQDKSLALNKLSKEYQSLQIEKNSMQKKEENLSEKLSQITQRMSVVDEALLTKLQVQLQLAQAKRILLAYPIRLKLININYWTLNEQLLEKMNLNSAH